MQDRVTARYGFVPGAVSWILAAAFLFGTVAYSGSFDHGYYAPKQLIFLFASGLAACALAIGFLLPHSTTRNFIRRPECFAAVLLLLWCCLSAAWAHSSYFLWKDGPLYLGALLLFLLLSDTSFQQGHFRRILIAFFLGALIHASLGCAQAVSGLDFISQSAHPAGLFGNRNYGSQVAFAAVPVGFFFLLTLQRRMQIFLVGISLGILLSYTIFTTTRSVFLASVLGFPFLAIATFLIYKKREDSGFFKERIVGLVLALGIICILVLPAYPGQQNRESLAKEKFERSQTALAESFGEEGLGADPAMGNRLTMWNNSIAAFLDRPLTGHGFGTWEAVYYEYAQSRSPDHKLRPGYTYHHAHNFYVEQLVNIGLIGLFLLFTTVALVARRALASFLAPDSSTETRVLLLMLAYGVTAILVPAFFSMPLDYPVLPSVLAVYGACLARRGSYSTTEAQVPPTGFLFAAAKWASITILLLGGGYCLLHARRERALQLHLHQCQNHYRSGDRVKARHYAEQVLRIDPHHVIANNRLAMLDIRNEPDSWLPPLRRIEAAYPLRPSNLALLALNHTRRGDLEGALGYWNRLLAVCPRNERALKEAVGASYKAGKIDGAIRHCETLVEAYPENESYQQSLQNLKGLASGFRPDDE